MPIPRRPLLLLALPLFCAAALCSTAALAEPVPEYRIEIDASADENLAPTAEKLRAVFQEGYPKLVKRFQNAARPAPTTVPLVFEKGLNHPAHASRGKLTFSVEWFLKHPDDLGVMTHELTHIVQAYPGGNPGWLVEGVADYARHLYGPKSDPWKVPAKLVEGRHRYNQGYGVTARFLLWLEEQKPGVVDELHRRMQAGTFKPAAFEELAGKNIDALWADCLASFK